MSHRVHSANLDDMLVYVGRFEEVIDDLDLDPDDWSIDGDDYVLVLSDPGNMEHWVLPAGGDEPGDGADLVAELVIRIMQTQRSAVSA